MCVCVCVLINVPVRGYPNFTARSTATVSVNLKLYFMKMFCEYIYMSVIASRSLFDVCLDSKILNNLLRRTLNAVYML